ETGRAMRMLDPTLELVAVGSSGRTMPTFGEWEHTVLMHAYEQVDMISAHAYYWEKATGLQEFLVSAEDMDRFIDSVAATIDAVATAKKTDKKVGISFDEWNVWYIDGERSQTPSGDDWPVGPRLLEDNYSVADAVVVGSLLISLLRHTDRVWSANLAQLVNVIAPIMTEPGGPAWKQTTFHPFALTSAHAQGEVLRVLVDGPTVESVEFGTVPAIDAVATWADDAATVFVVNRSATVDIPVTLDLPAGCEVVEAVTLHHDDPYWKASVDDDSSVGPKPNETVTVDGARVSLELPAISWTMVRLSRR
ncbi:MAG TPA: alpha-L-arabinofuranosidase, partial [Tessaracoccus flavescens]|nr:alpha-L-arabinofuranosidase [Tessaracoccus flavescens]